ncbi:MAG: beta strand repeat-containing protein, partial [Bacteroidota bacterium]
MKKALLIVSLLILLISLTLTAFAGGRSDGSSKIPEGAGTRVYGVHGGAAVLPESFDYMTLPHITAPYNGPILEQPEPVDPEPELVSPPLINSIKNVHMLKVVEQGGQPSPTLPSVGTGFFGPTQGAYQPTEPQVAAGPLGLFATSNVEVITATKAGGSVVHTVGTTFFGSADAAVSDAVTYYDAINGRFIACSFTTDAATYSHMYLAISKTNDATGAWWKYNWNWNVDGTTTTTNFADFQKIGVSGDKIVITSQQFFMSGTASLRTYQYQKARVFDRATLYSGGAASFVDFVNYPGQSFVTIPAKEYSPDSTIYLMATQNGGGNALLTGTITGPSSNPVLVAGNVVPVQTYGATAGMYHASGFIVGGSTAYRVADGDNRLNNFFMRNGFTHTVFHYGVVIGSDTVDAIKYVELNTKTNPWSVVRDETYSSAAFWYYYPEIAIDSAGTVFLGMDGSSKTVPPSHYVSGQRRNEASPEAATQVKAGTSVPATSVTRWGDYISGDMDASASGPGASVAWMAGQATTSTTVCGNWLQQLTFPYNQINGQVLNDADGNIGTTGDRTPLAGWTVQLKQGSTVLQTAVTDVNGNYSFGYMENGTYTIALSQLTNRKVPLGVILGTGGFSSTKIDNIDISDSLVMTTSTGQTSTGNIFIQTPNTASISGTVFNDLNSNGVKDPGEPALVGWTVNLTGTSSGSTTTDGSGNYSFTGLTTGSYTVSDVILGGYTATIPITGSTAVTISAADSQVTAITFGNISSSTMTWTGGGTTQNWDDPANWNPNGVPNSSTPVSISSAATVLVDVAATCGGFTLGNSGATVTIQSGQSLAVTGNFNMSSGTFNTLAAFASVSGTTSLTGGTVGYTATSGSQTVAALSYVNLTVSGGGTSTLASGTTSVSGGLTVSGASTLNLNGQILTPGGSATLAVNTGGILQTGGTSLAGFSTYSFNTTASTISYTGAAENVITTPYGSLTAAGSSTKTLLGNTTVNGILTLAQIVATGSNTLTLGSAGTVSATTGYVYGSFAKSVTATGLMNWEVGVPSTSAPVSLNISALTGSGSVTIKTTSANPATAFMGDPTKAIAHYFTITIGSGISSITAIPGMGYSLAEFNTLTGTSSDQTKLFLARWTGASWSSLRTTSNVSTQATGSVPGVVTLTAGVSTFSPWGIFWGTTDAPLSSSGLTLRSWIGAGSGGAGTDFNTATNWSPNGVPGPQDSCFFNLSSAATITLSADITIGALRIWQGASATGIDYIDVMNHTLTINGTQMGRALSASATVGVYLCIENGGYWINNGNRTDSCNTSGIGMNSWYTRYPAATGAVIIRGNLNLGAGSWSLTGNLPPNLIFDAPSSQTVYDSSTFAIPLSQASVQVGMLYNPTVLFAGSQNTLTAGGSITLNGSSVLDLSTHYLNGTVAADSLILNGTSKLRLSGTTGGQTGSNFPSVLTKYLFSSGSTIEYYGGSQTIYAPPPYQNLMLTTTGTKTAGAALSIAGNLTINSGTFAPSTFSSTVGGNITNNGTITPSTSTITLNGTGSQSISGTTTPTTLGSLIINKASGTASLGVNITCASVLTVTSGTFSLGTYTANRASSGGTLTVGAGATLDMGGTNGMPTQYSTHTLNATSTESFSGTNQTLTTVAETFGNLSFSGSGTKTFAAQTTVIGGNFTTSGTASATAAIALTINGNVSIGSGTTFNAGSFTHIVKGNWSNSGTFTAGTSTISLSGTSSQGVGASTFNNVTLSNSAGATLSGNSIIGGALTLTTGTLGVGANTLSLNGPTIAGTPANLITASGSSLSFGGSSAGVNVPSSVTTLTNLTVNNTNGVTLNSSPAISGALTLTNGAITTGSNTLTANGTVSRTSGFVAGNFQKPVATGPTSITYEIGSGTSYTPVQIAFGTVSGGGNLTAKTTSGDHPNLSTSGLNGGKSVNRYWTLTNSGVTFDTYSATLNFVS